MFDVQPYAQGNQIATGNRKAEYFMGPNHTIRDWWKYHAAKDGWLLAVKTIDAEPQGMPVVAHVNRNRWTAPCNTPGCDGCAVVEPRDPVFFCLTCMNIGMSGIPSPPRPVIFPDQIEQIEQILLLRPNPVNRNWEVNETVQDLERENIEHGLDHA